MATIAVVEDDANLSRLMRDVLAENGHQTISYVQPSCDTLEHLRELHPAVVIVDANLNRNISGWDLIEQLKTDPDTRSWPVVLCTGDAGGVSGHREFLERYHVPVLAKPFDLEELDSIVESALAV